MDINNIVLVGRLVRDTELKYTPKGLAVCHFAVANNRKGSDNQEIVSFFNIVVFGKFAEVCNKYLKKGSQACINGKLSQRSYEKDGQSKSIIEIIADDIQFLGNLQKQDKKDYGSQVNDSGIQIENSSSIDDDIPF